MALNEKEEFSHKLVVFGWEGWEDREGTCLCERCMMLLSRLETSFSRWEKENLLLVGSGSDLAFCLHPDAQSHISSIRSGCPFCIQIHHIFSKRGWELPTLATTRISWSIYARYTTPATPSLRWGFVLGDSSAEGVGMKDITQMVALEPDRLKSQTECFIGKPPQSCRSTHTSSQQVADLLSWWYNQCLNSHPRCNRVSDPATYPPRLLRVDGEICKLVDTAMMTRGPYTALSYCWGSDPNHLLLTDTNMSRLPDGIDCADLPQTFQDAMLITKRLGICYIWIDSLCIVQKGESSGRDWLRHLKIMGSIYENCTLNIAAAHSPDAHGGCFSSRDAFVTASPVIDLCIQDKVRTFQIGSKAIQVIPGHFPLNKRGWVFQERMLAPRTVHFTHHQIFWERSHVPAASETFPWGISLSPEEYWRDKVAGRHEDELPEYIPPFSLHSIPVDSPAHMHSEWALEILREWEILLESYSSTSLTRPEDKFPAIAGIAAKVSKEIKQAYLAGFFRSQFPHALCWKALAPGLTRRFRKPYRAPSWSWASTDGPLELPFRVLPLLKRQEHVDTEDAEVLGVSVTPATGADAFGQIESASIKLRGPAIKATGNPVLLELSTPVSKESAISNTKIEVFWDDDDEAHASAGSSVLLFVIYRWSDRQGFMCAYGLVLCPALESNVPVAAECYRRLGLFSAVYFCDPDDAEEERRWFAGHLHEITII